MWWGGRGGREDSEGWEKEGGREEGWRERWREEGGREGGQVNYPSVI